MFRCALANLSFKKSPLVGVELATEMVKIMVLARQANTYIIKNFATFPLPLDTIVNQKIIQAEFVTQAVKHTLALAKCKTSAAVIAVPAVTVMTKLVQMEAALNAAALEAEIGFEVEKYMPYPVEDISVDFHKLGLVTDQPSKVNIWLVAALTKPIQERIAILSQAGLSVKIVDVEPYALQRAVLLNLSYLSKSYFEAYILSLDISPAKINFLVMHNEQLIYTHEETGNHANDVNLIFSQIQRCLEFFYASAYTHKLAHILLSGSLASLPALASLLQHQLEIAVHIADPLKNMHFAAQIDAHLVRQQTASLMLVTGLALRGLCDASN